MPNLFPDRPIRDTDSDKLGIKAYADALAQFMRTCDSPLTIGIQGDWGTGKTSTLNLIVADLESGRKKIPFVWLNTWNYAQFKQDEYLAPAIINGLLAEVRDKFGISGGAMERGKKAISRVLKSVSGSIAVAGVSFDPKKLAEKEQGLADNLGYQDLAEIMRGFRKDFEEIVRNVCESQSSDRIVVFIDDLDRVVPVKALELLESVKNFLDVPGCVFVLAVDYEVVQHGMAAKLGHDFQKSSGKSFFDKIIQLPFTMPTGSYSLPDYVAGLLQESRFIGSSSREIDHDDRHLYAEIISTTVGRNPRSIKRVINYASLLEIIRSNHSTRSTKVTRQDRRILFALVCMQVAWPEISDFFFRNPSPQVLNNIENWDYIDRLPRIQRLFDRHSDLDQLKADISAFCDLFFSIVDTDMSGVIDAEEFSAVFRMMQIAKLTTVEDFRSDFERFFDQVEENNKKARPEIAIGSHCIGALKQSKWCRNPRISLKYSGTRYATLTVDRSQAGKLGRCPASTRPLHLPPPGGPVRPDGLLSRDCCSRWPSRFAPRGLSVSVLAGFPHRPYEA